MIASASSLILERSAAASRRNRSTSESIGPLPARRRYATTSRASRRSGKTSGNTVTLLGGSASPAPSSASMMRAK